MLCELPGEILIAICEQLPVQDLLNLQQTCRGLHGFGSADHLWRRLKCDIPLDLSVDRHEVPGWQIQQSAVRALRLERNWSQPESRTRRLTRIPHVGNVVQLQFIGPAFIGVLSQSNRLKPTTHLSIWRIDTLSEFVSVELPRANNTKFVAAHSNQEAIIALSVGGGHVKSLLQVLAVPLHEVDDGRDNNAPVPREIFSETRPHYGEIFFDVHISGSIVVSGLAKLEEDISSPMTYQLLLIDIANGASSYVGIPTQGLSRIQLKLYHDALFIAGVQDGRSVVISTHNLPDDITSIPDGDQLTSIAKYRTGPLPLNFEYYLASEPTTHSGPPLPLYLFHTSTSILASSKGMVSTFSVPETPMTTAGPDGFHLIEPWYKFEMCRGASFDIVCPGESGHRMVWLERRWDTEDNEYRFMKASLSKVSGLLVAPVWPAYVALPFQPRACQAMCFEECSGRICFALYTEEIYLVEF